MGPDLLDGDVELTEFEAIDVQSIKGVKKGANGFPILLMKGLPAAKADGGASDSGDSEDCPTCDGDGKIRGNSTKCPDCDGTGKVKAAKSLPAWHSPAALLVRLARENPQMGREALYKAVTADGQVDEQPDIDGGKQAIALLAKLIGYEAQELEAGCMGEVWDIQLLCDAIGAVKCWLSGEVAGQMADAADGSGVVMASVPDDEHEALTKAKLSTSELNDLPDSAFAHIEPGHESEKVDGKTPGKYRHFAIHDKAHADNAAARIAQGAKFGDKAKPKVEAAQKKFGESDTSKSTVAESDGSMQTDHEDTGSLSKAVEDALTKALEPIRQELGDLRAFKAKVEAAPVPGGPVMSAVRAQRTEGGEDWAAKAAYYEELAKTVSDRQSADGYRLLARQAREKITAAAPAAVGASAS